MVRPSLSLIWLFVKEIEKDYDGAMRNFLIRWSINVMGLLIISKTMESIEIEGLLTAIVAAAVIGLINTFLRPILILLTFPIAILTLGLFTLVINGLIFYFVGSIVAGFYVAGFRAAFLGALTLSIINILATFLISMRSGRAFVHFHRRNPGDDQ